MAEFKTSSGATISYHDSGAGLPILFLHSFGHNKNLWAPQLSHFLEMRYRVLAPDMPGHGESSFHPERHTVDAMAEDYLALLGHLNITQAVLAGTSMGGYIALRMWARKPNLFKALILSNTKAESDSEEIVARRRSQIENIKANGLEWFVTNGAPRRLSPATVQHRPWVLDTIKLLNFTVSAEANAATLEAMAARADDTAVLSTIDVPALIISGNDDAFIPKDSAHKLHTHIKRSQLIEIPDTGHVTALEAPSEYNRHVEAFLKANSIF